LAGAIKGVIRLIKLNKVLGIIPILKQYFVLYKFSFTKGYYIQVLTSEFSCS